MALALASKRAGPSSLFHTSATVLKGKFVRDELPHVGVDPVDEKVDPEDTGPSFRRLTPTANAQDWARRRGRWPMQEDYVKPQRALHNPVAKSKILSDVNEWASAQLEKRKSPSKWRSFSTSSVCLEFGLREQWKVDTPPPVPSKSTRDPSRNAPRAPTSDTRTPVIKNRIFNADAPKLSTPKNRPADPVFLKARFTSPPLLSGLLSSLMQLLGRSARPTPIQTLSMQHFLEKPPPSGWTQHLLASETGSGKSVAYMLPLLQHLKEGEKTSTNTLDTSRQYNPRAIVLAPTHELSRQLAAFAKALLHEIKLRVVCVSKANVKNRGSEDARDARSASHMKSMMESVETLPSGELVISRPASKFPADIVVGTPMKLLEMVRGRGWDRVPEKDGKDKVEATEEEEDAAKHRRGRDMNPGYGDGESRGKLGLKNVEWVVVDEADILFDPDFQATTRLLLSDISAARGSTMKYKTEPSNLDTEEKEPHDYPFHLTFTTATVPTSLDKYLNRHHPKLTRLTSPNLHHFPPTLIPEYVSWTGGNKLADIEKRMRRIWAEEAKVLTSDDKLSKVLIFCNKSSKVEALGHYLKDKGISNVALTSQGEVRQRGSNKHLDGFLKAIPGKGDGSVPVAKYEEPSYGLKDPAADEDATPDTTVRDIQTSPESPSTISAEEVSEPDVPAGAPRVMITTSLLSRGLDFTPDIKHVFIIDEPRNVIDFLHRAGRAARGGQKGKVVIFGKTDGRGSDRMKVVKKRVLDLRA